jgi:hypothetical protein
LGGVGIEDRNGFEATFVALELALLAFLLAAARRPSPAFALVDPADRSRAGLPEDDVGDLLGLFLDIRLPFVAFGGSIMSYRESRPARGIRTRRWASLTAPEYGYKEIDAPPVRPVSRHQVQVTGTRINRGLAAMPAQQRSLLVNGQSHDGFRSYHERRH